MEYTYVMAWKEGEETKYYRINEKLQVRVLDVLFDTGYQIGQLSEWKWYQAIDETASVYEIENETELQQHKTYVLYA